MGLLNLIKKSPDIDSLYRTNDDYTISRLRHAIFGDWFASYEMILKPWPIAKYYNQAHRRVICSTTLEKCNCGDCREDDGRLIVPCHHMYRLALESGRFAEIIDNPEIKQFVSDMRTPLFNSFLELVNSGNYEMVKTWHRSKTTFEELEQLGIVQGDQEDYTLTPFFKKNAAAFIYYTLTDPRTCSDDEADISFNPARQLLKYPV